MIKLVSGVMALSMALSGAAIAEAKARQRDEQADVGARTVTEVREDRADTIKEKRAIFLENEDDGRTLETEVIDNRRTPTPIPPVNQPDTKKIQNRRQRGVDNRTIANENVTNIDGRIAPVTKTTMTADDKYRQTLSELDTQFSRMFEIRNQLDSVSRQNEKLWQEYYALNNVYNKAVNHITRMWASEKFDELTITNKDDTTVTDNLIDNSDLVRNNRIDYTQIKNRNNTNDTKLTDRTVKDNVSNNANTVNNTNTSNGTVNNTNTSSNTNTSNGTVNNTGTTNTTRIDNRRVNNQTPQPNIDIVKVDSNTNLMAESEIIER